MVFCGHNEWSEYHAASQRRFIFIFMYLHIVSLFEYIRIAVAVEILGLSNAIDYRVYEYIEFPFLMHSWFQSSEDTTGLN